MKRRTAVYLDVENLIYDFRETGDWLGAAAYLLAIVHRIRARATLVAGAAACDEPAARRLAIPLGAVGIRTFAHGGGSGAADRILLRAIAEAPRSADSVVIASGDHAFALAAADLRARGKRVVVMSIPDRISADLYIAANHYVALPATRVNAEQSEGFVRA